MEILLLIRFGYLSFQFRNKLLELQLKRIRNQAAYKEKIDKRLQFYALSILKLL